jgi:hypothetical protein
MTEKQLSKQPRALTTESLVVQPYYKAGMHAELQKFGQDQENRQLILGEDTDTNSVDIYGLDLSVPEDKALCAIQILLDKTNYEGNLPGEIVQSSGWSFDGHLPRISITFSDYYEAYGLKPAKDGRYHGRQAQEALDALKSLAETRRISYKRKRYDKNRKKLVYDVIRVNKPIISVIEGYYDLEEQEAQQVIAGETLPEKRQTKLVIEVSPLLVDQIDSFYLLKPTSLHDEIKALYPGKRISKSVPLFLQWLLTLDIPEMKINRDTLAVKLRLDYLIDQRKKSQLSKRILEALETAKELNYLLAFREEPTGLLVLSLNPERCKRLKAKRKTKE